MSESVSSFRYKNVHVIVHKIRHIIQLIFTQQLFQSCPSFSYTGRISLDKIGIPAIILKAN